MKKTFKKLAAMALASAFALSAVVAAPVKAAEASDTDASGSDAASDYASGYVDVMDKSGTYHAYLYLQGASFTFRDAFDNENTGGVNKSPLFNQLTFKGDTSGGESVPGTFQDAEIKGNGTYTVSASGIQWPEDEFADQDHMNLIGVSFDMPVCDDITISDVVLKVDGAEVSHSAKTLAEADKDKSKLNTYNLLIQNKWNEDEAIKSIGYYQVPFSEISVTFTISGFDYDNPDATGETVDDATSADTSDDASSATDATTEKTTEADDKKDDGGAPVLPIVIVVVVVIAVVAGVIVVKKKK